VAEDVVGQEHVQLLQKHLNSLRPIYNHPNRILHFDTVLTTLLLGFFNPAVRSLRTLEDLSQAERLAEQLPIHRVCRSTLSDALAKMNAAHLLPIVRELASRLPHLRRQDGDLHSLLKTIIALDGSVFTVPADVLWAIQANRSNGKSGRQIRLNMQLDVLQFMPTGFSVSGGFAFRGGAADGSESAAFAKQVAESELLADVVYLCDRNFVDFKFIHAVFDKNSDIVVRLKADTRFDATEDRPLSEQDRAANVICDRVGHVPGSAGSPGFGQRLLREVIVLDPRSGKQVRLLTSLLDVPARIIGLLYRHRWMIELFFKWLKCVANVKRLFSQSHNGITVEFYVAVIGLLLTHLRTGRQPSLYAFNCLGLVASGQMSAATMQTIVDRRQRERDLEKARLAKKAAQKMK
jgi:hypothetical protein